MDNVIPLLSHHVITLISVFHFISRWHLKFYYFIFFAAGKMTTLIDNVV